MVGRRADHRRQLSMSVRVGNPRTLALRGGLPMPDDIYKKQPITVDSSEHVLPDALGGKLQVRGVIDKTTNDWFGGGIDAALERGLRAFRLLLDARNSHGDPPAALA